MTIFVLGCLLLAFFGRLAWRFYGLHLAGVRTVRIAFDCGEKPAGIERLHAAGLRSARTIAQVPWTIEFDFKPWRNDGLLRPSDTQIAWICGLVGFRGNSDDLSVTVTTKE